MEDLRLISSICDIDREGRASLLNFSELIPLGLKAPLGRSAATGSILLARNWNEKGMDTSLADSCCQEKLLIVPTKVILGNTIFSSS